MQDILSFFFSLLLRKLPPEKEGERLPLWAPGLKKVGLVGSGKQESLRSIRRAHHHLTSWDSCHGPGKAMPTDVLLFQRVPEV